MMGMARKSEPESWRILKIDSAILAIGCCKSNLTQLLARPDGHSKCPTYGQSNCSTPTTVN